MATFQFTSRRVDLEFPGGITCSIPLTEEMRQKVEAAAKELSEKAAQMHGKAGTAEDLETLCDYTLDAVDAILGEGVADKIVDAKEDYSFLDCTDLFNFVTGEFINAFIREANAAKGNRSKPTTSSQPVSVPNRAQRRHKRCSH